MSEMNLSAKVSQLPELESMGNAVKCEQSGHVMEAILLYEENIFKLQNMQLSDPQKQKYLKLYESHALQLRERVRTHLKSSRMLEHISIERGARGRGYQRLFGKHLDDSVKEAHINEPQLSEAHHFKNLINFLEVLVKNCRYLKFIRLTTRPEAPQGNHQLDTLQQIRSDLATGNIHMQFQLDENLNDRKIVLSSGIIIKIGRGLHYFDPKEDSSYALGMCDYDFRKCLPTEVDIWKCRAFAKLPKESIPDSAADQGQTLEKDNRGKLPESY